MKKAVRNLLNMSASAVLILSMFETLILSVLTPVQTHAFSGAGNGSTTHPYRINTCDQLQAISENVSAHYVITDDIYCSNPWTPINDFTGELDGRNHQVFNISVNSPSTDRVGMFAKIIGGTVKDLVVGNTYIIGHDMVGGLVGETSNGAVIDGVTVHATVSGVHQVGGLVGLINNNGTTIRKSAVTYSTITGQATGYNLGGLVGMMSASTVEDSYASATVQVTSDFVDVGGLVGIMYPGASISRSYSGGTIDHGRTVGGLVGFYYADSNNNTIIADSFTTTTRTNTDYEGGGLVARFYQNYNVTNSFYDAHNSGSGYCDAYSGGSGGCTAVNADGSDPNHFKGVTNIAPFTTGNWDFTSTWQTGDGYYPYLQYNSATVLPSVPLPNAPTSLSGDPNGASSVSLSWTAPNNDGSGDATDYIIEYKLTSDTDWTAFDDGTSSDTSATVTGLTPNTSYDFRVSTVSAGGQSSASDPTTVSTGDVSHSITTCEQLQDIALANSGDYELASDIDCSGTSSWNGGQGFAPIPNFSGTFDGHNHTISGLTINRPFDVGVGLFSSIEGGGTVSNLVLGSGTITGSCDTGGLAGDVIGATITHVTTLNLSIYGNCKVGAVIGKIDAVGFNSTIRSVTSSSQVQYTEANGPEEADYVGGIIGFAQVSGATLTLTNITSHTWVDARSSVGSWGTGGVIGELDVWDDGTAELSGLSYDSHVYGDTGQAVGGLIGATYSFYYGPGGVPGVINLSNSYSNGYVEGNTTVGGLVGAANANDGGALNLALDYSTSSVNATGNGLVGGFIGELETDSNGSSVNIEESYSEGEIAAAEGAGDVGGFVGYSEGYLGVSDSYSRAIVSGAYEVGGLAGYANTMAVFNNTYFAGEVHAPVDNDIGGLVGFLGSGMVYNSFATGLVEAQTGVFGLRGGLIGGSNGPESVGISNSYYAANTTYQFSCIGGGGFGECNEQSNDEGGYYFDSNNQPLSSWDFTSTWTAHASALPTLAAYDAANTPTIHNCMQLQAIAENPSGDYTLANDIDCHDTANWNGGNGFAPINNFSGTLDGAGHAISGLTIHRVGTTNIGLFDTIRGGSVQNVILADAVIAGNGVVGVLAGVIDGDAGGTVNQVMVTDAQVTARYDGGALIGQASSLNTSHPTVITASSTSGTVQHPAGVNNNWSLGGLIGEVYVGESGSMTIANDSSSATIVAGSYSNTLGGLIGSVGTNGNPSLIMGDLLASGNITASGADQVGGLIGLFQADSYNEQHFGFTNLAATGSISGAQHEVGGLIGELDSYYGAYVSIRGASAQGAITDSSGGYAIGGLIGIVTAQDGHVAIRQSYATGSMNTPNSSYVGGLVGEADSILTVINSYATGSVTGSWQLGGLLGAVDAIVMNSYASGAVATNGGENVGGFIGWLGNGIVKNSFSTGLVSGADGYTDVTGFVGGYRNATLTNNYYDRTSSNQPNCSQIDGFMLNNDAGSCEAVNADGTDAAHFLGTPGALSQPMLNTWNFQHIWLANDAALPTLSAVGSYATSDAPTNLAATGDKHDLHLSWDAPANSGSPVVAYRVEYKDPTTSYWTRLGEVSDTSMDVDPWSVNWFATYDFRVIAITEEAESAPSDTMTYVVGETHLISSCEDLQHIDDDLSGAYYLTQDIDCSDTVNWNNGYGFRPIGLNSDGFTGILNGMGYKITGLFEDNSENNDYQYGGLFYQTGGATLTNFSLIGGSITGHWTAGAVASQAYATNVSRVYSNLPVTSTGGEDVGGLFGEYYSDSGLSTATISRSASTGDVTGQYDVGGLVGYTDANAEISNSFYHGNVISNDWYAGGLVGYAGGDLHINNSYAAGRVEATTSSAGGLVGSMGDFDARISNSFAANLVISGDTDYRGSLVGNWYGNTDDLSHYFTNNYTDTTAVGTSNCINNVDGVVAGCTAINGNGLDSNYFLNNTSNPPLNTWDFELTWQTNTADYPTLQGFDYTLHLDPPVLSDTGITSSRVFLHWNAKAGADHYELQYKLSSDDDTAWQDYHYMNGSDATSVVVNGLTNSTSYDFRIRTLNADESNTSEWSDTFTATTGTQAYVITNCDQLQDINGDLSGTYYLEDSIDCSDTSSWNGGAGFYPIAYNRNPGFSGALIGNGYNIRNLTINRPDDNYNYGNGLFYQTNGALIQDIRLQGGSVTSLYSAAALVVFANTTTIKNVRSDLDVTTLVESEECTGGLVGCYWSPDPGSASITGSSSTGNVSGFDQVGGLAGYVSGATIERSYSTGSVNGRYIVGGFAGALIFTNISDSYANGDVVVSGDTAGGFAGEAMSVEASNLYSSGSLDSPNYSGGLFGYTTNINLSDSFTNTRIVNPEAPNLGAVIGMLNDWSITNTYYDLNAAAGLGCVAANIEGTDLSDCHAYNDDGTDANHFVGTTSASPLDLWNFNGVWFAHSDALPTLVSLPQFVLKAQPGLHSMKVLWELNTFGSPITDLQLEYREHGTSEWIPVTIDSLAATDTTVTDLKAGTQYEFRFKAATEGGVIPWTAFITSTLSEHQSASTTPTVVGKSVSRQASSKGASTTTTSDVTAGDDVTINLDDFSEYTDGAGKELKLKVGQIVHFTLTRNGKTEQHTATVKELGDGYVVLTIASTPFDVRVNLNETKTVSIDGATALKVRLTGVNNGEATLVFSKVAPHAKAGKANKANVQHGHHYLGYIFLAVAAGLFILVVKSRRRQDKHAK